MPNALQDFMRGIASGNFDITRPYFRAQAAGQQRNAQALAQQQLAERIRQFNIATPIHQQQASTSALNAQTGVKSQSLNQQKYDTRLTDQEAKTRMKTLEDMVRTLQPTGDVTGQAQIASQIGQPAIDQGPLPAIEKNAWDERLSHVQNEAHARQNEARKTATTRAGLKGDAQGKMAERQATAAVARAFHSRSTYESSDMFKKSPAALAAVQRELANALLQYKQTTGRPAPTQQEMIQALAEVQSLESQKPPPTGQPQPTTTSTLSPEDEAIRRAMQGK